jgi:HEAT repeat protein
MTGRKAKALTADEIIAELHSDPVWVAHMQERERFRQEQVKRLQAAEVPLVAALKEAGVDVTSSWDLVNTGAKYPEAIPVLLEHLKKDYPKEILEGIARALGVPEARPYRRVILDAYANTENNDEDFKIGLGLAVVGATTDEDLSEIIGLIRDSRHGNSRVALLFALKRSRSEEAKRVIEELRNDPVFSTEINSWRKRKK